ncbi:MAG TPA: excinuclease ABC subunit UvrC [Spirochaetales bacterium]|nr:excinuclease ABC subunit UvrC [Spirochaetales bacterium]HPG86921.1 excinuclease ABC subunit UvrC [Spirochaetales bacterium]HPM72069.1 excinuclease ABC subunit UvrC [Spirochaetales bacterium]
MDENKARPSAGLRNSAKQAPEAPGVYLWKDADGVVIYVGKAKSLKARLASYFTGKREIKTRHLVAKASTLEWILTETEYEALLLENNLIKRYAPKYNINLKDGKTYPSIRITNEEYPRVFRTRRIVDDGSRYFGPYPSADVIDRYLELVRRLFPLRRCKTLRRRETPCMYYHIGRCSAPCAGKTTREEYALQVERVATLLSGDSEALVEALRADMAAASEALQFEKAAYLRDSVQAIESFRGDSGVVDFAYGDRDYLAWAVDGSLVDFVVFQTRSGRLVGRDLYRERSFGSEAEAASEFMAAYYGPERLPPPEVFVKDAEGLELAADFLRRGLGAAFRLAAPDERRHEAALAMAEHNAREDLAKRRRESGDVEALEALRAALGLEVLPELIEGFDIAQLSGKHTVASLVSFRNGAANKKGYRIYKIKSLDGGIDDFGAMREATARHYTHVANDEAEAPDLVLIDGGRGQVNAAWEILDALGLDLPVVGLAKENEELWPHGAREPVVLPKDSPALRLVVAVRDEAHRFATGMNQRLRGKALGFPVLEAVKGVGPTRARRIMDAFGSLAAVAEAEPSYIAARSGLDGKTAEAVRDAASRAASAMGAAASSSAAGGTAGLDEVVGPGRS